MSEPQEIKTGIYKRFKGGLYFVVGLIDDKDFDTKKVFYYPLYEKSNGCCRNPEVFNGLTHDGVKRFELIKELDPKYLDILLPGNFVKYVHLRIEILSCSFGEENEIFIKYSYGTVKRSLSMGEYLEYWGTRSDFTGIPYFIG